VVPKILEFRLRHADVLRTRAVQVVEDADQALRLLEGERLQKHGVHNSEDGDVGPDAKRQREDGGGGEAGSLQKASRGVAQVREGLFQPNPRYGFLLVTLTGENANLPEVCHGIRQLLAPCSIALTIWDVTRSYTSRFSVAVFSFVDIVKLTFRVVRAPCASPRIKAWHAYTTVETTSVLGLFLTKNEGVVHVGLRFEEPWDALAQSFSTRLSKSRIRIGFEI
jgi:hypothetical protein